MKYTFIHTDGSRCETIEISGEHLTMTADGFEQMFFDEAKRSATYMEAYEKVEIIHEQIFNKRRYSDYNSFQTAKSKRYNSRHDTRKDSF